ncbi:LbetaH domain-containing protein [Granulicella arctica]|uniref:hypothetical protein n=1 Tax=Granulicella arctica TaxID=940613 RepID=UPI0021DFC68E|nr:hypothetical protein [Granulicella arctica]
MDRTLQDNLAALASRGVVLPDARQVYVAPDILLERIAPGAVLHPGTRLSGPRTFVGGGAQIGTDGPATLDNAVFANGSEIASGYIKDAVLLEGAKLGANAHVRAGTLLEEEASTAHAVGLKQTILMAFVTVGSLVNFCDALMSGGRSRKDHSEIGSGFIHFNFTPFGESGDKATPSLMGDVTHGAFLREDRIFLGGLSGLVGPQKVGFGSVTIAGQVVRKSVPAGHLYGSIGVEMDKPFSPHRRSAPSEKVAKNIDYLRELFALRSWYRDVRLAQTSADEESSGARVVLQESIVTIDECIRERTTRLNDLLSTFDETQLEFKSATLPCPLQREAGEQNAKHVDWVRGLSNERVAQGQAWLSEVAGSVIVLPLSGSSNKRLVD